MARTLILIRALTVCIIGTFTKLGRKAMKDRELKIELEEDLEKLHRSTKRLLARFVSSTKRCKAHKQHLAISRDVPPALGAYRALSIFLWVSDSKG